MRDRRPSDGKQDSQICFKFADNFQKAVDRASLGQVIS
jgi:hypothetical protein